MITAYADDSFWTLDWFGRIGVIGISAVGIGALFWVIAWKSRVMARLGARWIIPLDIMIGWAICTVVYSLSPQVFYTFYGFIFPDLPQQWVISGSVAVDRLQAAIDLRGNRNLSDDLAGITFWAIAPFTIWQHIRR